MLESLSFAFGEGAWEIQFPSPLQPEMLFLVGACQPVFGDSAKRKIRISEVAPDRFAVSLDEANAPIGDELARDDFPAAFFDFLVRLIATQAHPATALRACAVAWQGDGILIVGPEGSGKSLLTAWLVDRKFDYMTDGLVAVGNNDRWIEGLPGPIRLRDGIASMFSPHGALRDTASRPSHGYRLLEAPGTSITRGSRPCGVIIVSAFARDLPLSIMPLAPADARAALAPHVERASGVSGDDPAPIAALVDSALIFQVRFGHLTQLDGVMDILVRFCLESQIKPEAAARFLNGLNGSQAGASAPAESAQRLVASKAPIPSSTPWRGPARLTIGMATYDDYDGVYFTLQALRLYHSEILADVEFLVIDNNPTGRCAQPLKALENSIPNYRYIAEPDNVGTAYSRNVVFREAAGEFVLCMDCHVFVVPGALRRLLGYYDAYPSTHDLFQGPLLHDDLKTLSTHFAPEWRAGMYGTWGSDPRGESQDAPPFEIPMQGLGLFTCRRDAWPGFNVKFRAFGAEEGYIHEKFRQRGNRVLCLPFLQWLHRFERPAGVPYPAHWEDRVRNYMIGHHELGLPTDDIEAHFRTLLGHDFIDKVVPAIKAELDQI